MRIHHFVVDMREGLTVFEELIGMGDLQSEIWHTDCLDHIQYSNELTSDHYIVGKIQFHLYYLLVYYL